MEREGRKPKAVIVGGIIAGISTAHALTLAGWDVTVIEKTISPPTGNPTGAGLALNPISQQIINSWISHPQLINNITVPLTFDQIQVTDSEKKVNWTLIRDESFNLTASHWADLRGVLYDALPPQLFLWGHHFVSFNVANENGTSVIVKAKVLQTGEIIEIVGDFLVAADGCLSSIRQKYLPESKLRYSGYCAWRGVLDYSKIENSETIMAIKTTYPDLGKRLYFDLALGTHSVLYEIQNKKLNWIWYVNQQEPLLKGTSVTMKVTSDMIKKMHQDAEKVWIPELVKVIKETDEPFLNLIYDSDPLEKIFWNNTVLVGDAAHPITPHCIGSTNMSILLDAAVLGKCLEKWGAEKVESALEEYEFIRLPVTSKQVLHARCLGRLKQGLVLPHRDPFDPKLAKPKDCQDLLPRNTPFFYDVPSLFTSILSSI